MIIEPKISIYGDIILYYLSVEYVPHTTENQQIPYLKLNISWISPGVTEYKQVILNKVP